MKNRTMKTGIVLPLSVLPMTIILAIGLAACSPKAQNETAEAANTIVGDANATAAKAVDDTDAALGAAETRIDNAGDVLGNKAGAALKDAGNEIEE